jgi:hypothetical protein
MNKYMVDLPSANAKQFRSKHPNREVRAMPRDPDRVVDCDELTKSSHDPWGLTEDDEED